MSDNKEPITVQPIQASARHDPGCRDLFNCVKDNLTSQGGEEMDNLKILPNNDVITSDHPDYPATDHLFDISCGYKISDHKRNYVLVVEDMQMTYKPCVTYCLPAVKSLIKTFRDLDLPIIWTNWARTPEDGHYGGVDRFYGSQATKLSLNPAYSYGEHGHKTVDEIAPQNNQEMSRSINSYHLSKFGDLDEEGREILFPMLEAWGVNTIILVGAWTDSCLGTTVFDAVDKYGYDVVLVSDACATATMHGANMLEVLYSAAALRMSSGEVVEHLRSRPEMIEAPKAELSGDVRHRRTEYRHDGVLEEVEGLRRRVKELEEELERVKKGGE